MRNFRRIYRTTFLVLAFAFLHYTLPQHDVARITQTEITRYDPSWFNSWAYAQANSGNASMQNRDINLIYTQRRKTFLLGFIQRDVQGTMVYRNEDTGLWGWPPFFKTNSIDVQAEASDLVSTADDAQWVVIRHYGWRNQWFTILPNALSIRPVDTPNPVIIPWFNILFFIALGFGIVLLRAMLIQFRERAIDPLVEDISGEVDKRHRRLTKWADSWKSRR